MANGPAAAHNAPVAITATAPCLTSLHPPALPPTHAPAQPAGGGDPCWWLQRAAPLPSGGACLALRQANIRHHGIHWSRPWKACGSCRRIPTCSRRQPLRGGLGPKRWSTVRRALNIRCRAIRSCIPLCSSTRPVRLRLLCSVRAATCSTTSTSPFHLPPRCRRQRRTQPLHFSAWKPQFRLFCSIPARCVRTSLTVPWSAATMSRPTRCIWRSMRWRLLQPEFNMLAVVRCS